MRRIKIFIILFLSSNLFGCYSHPNIKKDVEKLSEINSNIKHVSEVLGSSDDLDNIYMKEITDDLIRYSNNIKANINDTSFVLVYTNSIYINQNNFNRYSSIIFTKHYFEDDRFHSLEIFNQDTLYHFTSLKSIEDSRFYEDYHFKKGKYFFIYERSRRYDTFGQKIYFYYNYDSLLNVKGNNVPDLPSIDSVSMKDFHYSEFYKEFKKDKPYIF